MANMDGSQPEQFYVFNDRMLIHCLTYSQEKHQLFWINALKNSIQLWDFKSNMIKMVYETSNPIASHDQYEKFANLDKNSPCSTLEMKIITSKRQLADEKLYYRSI